MQRHFRPSLIGGLLRKLIGGVFISRPTRNDSSLQACFVRPIVLVWEHFTRRHVFTFVSLSILTCLILFIHSVLFICAFSGLEASTPLCCRYGARFCSFAVFGKNREPSPPKQAADAKKDLKSAAKGGGKGGGKAEKGKAGDKSKEAGSRPDSVTFDVAKAHWTMRIFSDNSQAEEFQVRHISDLKVPGSTDQCGLQRFL